jgi:hypothetical protein
VLVLGGYFAVLGPWLKEPLEKAIRDRVIAPDGGGCRVIRSDLGFAAAVRGWRADLARPGLRRSDR